IYKTHPEMPTTEVAIRTGLGEDLYVIMSTVDPATKRGTFRIIVRPLVLWIWIGGLLLIFGTLLAATPSLRELLAERTDRSAARPGPRRRLAAAAVATGLLVLF